MNGQVSYLPTGVLRIKKNSLKVVFLWKSKNIIKHFKEKPNEGCYVCLCEKGYIHSVPYGFPGDLEKDMKCPNCGQAIGSEYIEEDVGKTCKIINRKDYARIFKDEDEDLLWLVRWLLGRLQLMSNCEGGRVVPCPLGSLFSHDSWGRQPMVWGQSLTFMLPIQVLILSGRLLTCIFHIKW